MGDHRYPIWVRLRNRARWEMRKFYDMLQDKKRGIDTRDRLATTYSDDLKGRNRPNEGTSYRALDIIANHLRPGPEDVFFDIGCGYGRTLLYFADKVKRSIGVELRHDVAEQARANVTASGARNVEIITGDAASQDYSSGTIIYIYNSFDADVMKLVLERLKGGRFRLCYVNPVENATLHQTDWLSNTENFWVPYKGNRMRVAMWEPK